MCLSIPLMIGNITFVKKYVRNFREFFKNCWTYCSARGRMSGLHNARPVKQAIRWRVNEGVCATLDMGRHHPRLNLPLACQ